MLGSEATSGRDCGREVASGRASVLSPTGRSLVGSAIRIRVVAIAAEQYRESSGQLQVRLVDRGGGEGEGAESEEVMNRVVAELEEAVGR